MPLMPFDPAKNKPKDVGKGGPSTELLITEYAPDGTVWNIPSLWWDEDGNPLELRGDLAMKMAARHEMMTGKMFPRFKTIEEGVAAAEKRSAAGGATNNILMYAPR